VRRSSGNHSVLEFSATSFQLCPHTSNLLPAHPDALGVDVLTKTSKHPVCAARDLGWYPHFMSCLRCDFPVDRGVVKTILVQAGIQPTQQRIDIAHLLFQRPQHLSAEQVLAGINEAYGHVSKATVYNTLNLFVRQGLINEVLIESDRTLYDSNTADHHHVYNVDTGELADIPADRLTIQGDLGLPAETEIEGMEVLVRVRERAPESTDPD